MNSARLTASMALAAIVAAPPGMVVNGGTNERLTKHKPQSPEDRHYQLTKAEKKRQRKARIRERIEENNRKRLEIKNENA